MHYIRQFCVSDRHADLTHEYTDQSVVGLFK